ncbi:hypothetical protein [Rhizobium sp. SG570]|uniref:hypothetical protein n=1 Tax=Rhizobium sp. SG570 TaxID=2587113 RepID=UPI001444C80B|nr:hypothetical protein [Rhizobium sp. SG570]NKJ40302.1 hypothetical protein [Rhizobium sp. SG570]
MIAVQILLRENIRKTKYHDGCESRPQQATLAEYCGEMKAHMSFPVYFVDIRLAAIREVRLPKERPDQEIRRLLDCREPGSIISPENLFVYFAQHGESSGAHSLANFEGIRNSITGNMIIGGADSSGHLYRPRLPITDVARRIELIRPYLDPVPHGGKSRGSKIDFQIRIARQTLVVQQ